MPRLSTIIGHETAVRRMRIALAHGAIGHAYLFAGPQGVGKTTTARSLAKALNCEQAGAFLDEAIDSCEVCAACRQADAGVHPDIHLIRPPLTSAEAVGPDRKTSVEIGIDQVRELLEMLSLTPSSGRRKVFILAPAEAMNERAQNALLKGLEEPPPSSTLILCASSPGSVLETVRSRCQVIQFGLVPREVIRHRMRELFALSTEQAQVAAAVGQGRVGWSIRYASESDWREARHALVGSLLALFNATPLNALLAVGPVREASFQIPVQVEGQAAGAANEAVVDRLAARLQGELLLEEMATLVRDLLVIRSHLGEFDGEADPADLVCNLDRLEEMRSIAAARAPGYLLHLLEEILTAQDLFRRNVNPQLLLEDLFLTVAGMK